MNYQAALDEIEKSYNVSFPKIFRTLWLDGMIDWHKGWDAPWTSEKNWYTEVYPQIKDKPPLLLHTGGYDFEMCTTEAILGFKNQFSAPTDHKFIPFAQTGAGDHYGFYLSDREPEQNAPEQSPIVLITHDDETLTFLSQNFENFIVRMMLTRVADIVEDDITEDFSGDFEKFRTSILADLKTISPYLKPQYSTLLEEIFKRPVKKECELLSLEDYKTLLKTHLMFDLFDQEFSLS